MAKGKMQHHSAVRNGVAFADNGKSQPSVQDLEITGCTSHPDASERRNFSSLQAAFTRPAGLDLVLNADAFTCGIESLSIHTPPQSGATSEEILRFRLKTLENR